MKIVLITQDDPFYLAKNLDYLITNIPAHSRVTAAIVLDVSPFGKRETFIQKAKNTLNIFGLGFFLHYAFRYFKSKLDPQKSVHKILGKHRVPLITIEGNINKEENLNKIRVFSPDIIISIAGNQIFRKPLIQLASSGCLNLHTALLPKYRGLLPSFWVLKNNESHTGVSVFYVDEGIDSGPILVQKKVEIGSKTQEELIAETKQIGMELIIEAINKIASGDTDTIPNPNESATYFSFPTKDDVREFKKAGKQFY